MKQRRVNVGGNTPLTPADALEDKTKSPAYPQKPHPYIVEDDFAEWAYTPHTITIGVICFAVLLYFGFVSAPATPSMGVKYGLAAAAIAFFTFGVVHLPDGVLVRPHPAVWRALLALAIMYLVVLIFLLYQDLPTIRYIMGEIDPALTVPLPERSYADDCRMSTEAEPYKFWSIICDEFLIAHALGYWAKAIVIRDWRVVTALSIGFEIIEVTFQHILPNFKECWWDHVLVDILICNAGGTILGMLTLRWLQARPYQWVKLADIKTLRGKASRVFGQLTPRQLNRYQWHMFASPKRYLEVIFVISSMWLSEWNCFAQKAILWQKPNHFLVIGRLVVFGFMAIPGYSEFYEYVSNPACKRLGTMAWVMLALVFTETLWVEKMRREGGFFTNQAPPHIIIPNAIAIASQVVWFTLYFSTQSLRMRARGFFLSLYRLFLALLFVLPAVAWTVLFFIGNPDMKFYQEEFDEYFLGQSWWGFWY